MFVSQQLYYNILLINHFLCIYLYLYLKNINHIYIDVSLTIVLLSAPCSQGSDDPDQGNELPPRCCSRGLETSEGGG